MHLPGKATINQLIFIVSVYVAVKLSSLSPDLSLGKLSNYLKDVTRQNYPANLLGLSGSFQNERLPVVSQTKPSRISKVRVCFNR